MQAVQKELLDNDHNDNNHDKETYAFFYSIYSMKNKYQLILIY